MTKIAIAALFFLLSFFVFVSFPVETHWQVAKDEVTKAQLTHAFSSAVEQWNSRQNAATSWKKIIIEPVQHQDPTRRFFRFSFISEPLPHASETIFSTDIPVELSEVDLKLNEIHQGADDNQHPIQ